MTAAQVIDLSPQWQHANMTCMNYKMLLIFNQGVFLHKRKNQYTLSTYMGFLFISLLQFYLSETNRNQCKQEFKKRIAVQILKNRTGIVH